MKELTIVYLALTVITIAGCTTSQIYYPANPEHLEQIPPDESFRVEMTDGETLNVSKIRVEGDSLFLSVKAMSTPFQVVHRDDVTSVSKRELSKTWPLFIIPMVAMILIIKKGTDESPPIQY